MLYFFISLKPPMKKKKTNKVKIKWHFGIMETTVIVVNIQY